MKHPKHIPTITFKAIPHKEHRYETVGDYFKCQENGMQFRVSKMNEDYEFLVLLHEFIEWFLVNKAGIKVKDIDTFDINFEKEREKGLHSEDEEPGDHKDAPYRKQHKFATRIERIVAKELGVDWDEYNDCINNL